MALSFLTSSGSTNSAKFFEIRVDSSNLILRGNEDESSSAILKGTLVLCLSEPLKVQSINLRLTGEARIGFPVNTVTGRSNYSYVKQEKKFLEKMWYFVNPKKGSETLPAGNYEYPFEFVINGDMPESIEGLPDSWIIYRMKASIDRGRLQTNLYAYKHIRVVRTFDPSALELAHAMSVDNTWPEKIDYSISTPSKGIIFGTKVPIGFALVPLLKGLKIGNIESELIELQNMATDAPASYQKREHCSTRTIGRDEWQLPENSEIEDIEGQEGYRITRHINMPKSLRLCVQTAEVMGIRIRHRLKFVIQLHNPDGHVSELRATLPVHVFLSPNLLLDDQNNLINLTQQSARTVEDLTQHAPPLYGEHQFDQLFSDLDPTGYMTPMGTHGGNTPFYSRSRTASHENLASMGSSPGSGVSANTLQNWLSNLQNPVDSRSACDLAQVPRNNSATSSSYPSYMSDTDTNTPPITINGELHPSRSQQSRSNPLSRRTSADDDEVHQSSGTHTPQHLEMSTEELSKVPSYNTAIHAPVRVPSYVGLPNYEAACSRPTTPNPPLPPPTHPVRAHTTPELYFVDADADARLRALQARGRR